jgi:hypothetical protein
MRFQDIIEKCHIESFLEKLPQDLASLHEDAMSRILLTLVPRPDLEDSVFCRVIEDIGEVQISLK